MKTLLLTCLLSLAAGRLSAAVNYDILIHGGTVVDGTGQERFRADIGINGDTIAAIGNLADCTATTVVDATGLIVTPGFIDLHNHSDDGSNPNGLRSADPLYRASQNWIFQGVTTGLINPDGSQPPVLAEQRRQLMQLGTGINAALVNGHNTLRALTMSKELSALLLKASPTREEKARTQVLLRTSEDLKRPATAAEVAAMQAIIRHDMEETGSFGMSLGLEYFSGLYSKIDELVELGKALAPYNGIFIPHIRSQGSAPMWYNPSVDKDPPPTLESSIREVLEVAEKTGVTADITHIKAWGPGYRGDVGRMIALIQASRDRGARVYCDRYPFLSAGSDGVFYPMSTAAFSGIGPVPAEDFDYTNALKITLENPSKYRDLEADILNKVNLKGGPENVRLLSYPNPAYVGKSLAELMKMKGLNLTDLTIALQLEGDAHRPGGGQMRAFSQVQEDVVNLYKEPWCATASDGATVLPERQVGFRKYIGTNQRNFGTFSRRLSEYTRDLKVDSLEMGVRSCSGLPAQILGILDRGRLAPGMKADVAVIDLAKLKDNTSPEEPSVYSTGVEYVLVNGGFALKEGKATLALHGRVLEPVGHPAHTPAVTAAQ